MPSLTTHPTGHYRFLPGIAPYSCGVVADPGHEIVRVALLYPTPWREGFKRVDQLLRDRNQPRASLCAMELRSPRPFSMGGFMAFNSIYCAVLEEWGVLVNGLNPVARTNVCPLDLDTQEPVLHAFSYVRPQATAVRPTFIVAGAGELVAGTLATDNIVRPGDTSPDALAEKAEYVFQVMTHRLLGLGVNWDEVTAVNAYTVHDLRPLLPPLSERMPAARRHGVCWHYTRPPVIDLEFEMDLHGIEHQTRI